MGLYLNFLQLLIQFWCLVIFHTLSYKPYSKRHIALMPFRIDAFGITGCTDGLDFYPSWLFYCERISWHFVHLN